MKINLIRFLASVFFPGCGRDSRWWKWCRCFSTTLGLAAMGNVSTAAFGQSYECHEFNFSPTFRLSAGAATSVAFGDFDADHRTDLVAVGQDGGIAFPLLLAGDGSFSLDTIELRVEDGFFPGVVVTGDFNGDGSPDLALLDFGRNEVVLMTGCSTDPNCPYFVPPRRFKVGGSGPTALTVGDFNGDGISDVAVANKSSRSISVLLGVRDGTFQKPMDSAVGANLSSVLAGDFNGDARLDLVVAGGSSTNVLVLLGQGDGTFEPAKSSEAGINPSSLNAADFNNDGVLDLAVVNSGSKGISILLGHGDGTFKSPLFLPTERKPTALAVGDLNGDGFVDLAVGNSNSSYVSVFAGKGDGTFNTAIKFEATGFASTEDDVTFLALEDLNRDGKLDIVVGAGSFDVLFNTCVLSPPTLAIQSSSENVTISWAFPSIGFTLESTPSLTPANWQQVTETPTNSANRFTVTVPASQRERYFRLRKQ